MLALLIFAIMSELLQPGVILQARNSLLVKGDRLYKESPDNFMGQLMITLFRVGVVTMAVYLCCQETGNFSFSGFSVVFGIVLAVIIVKMICNRLVDYVFGLSRRFGSAYEHYGNILTLATLVIYPVLLVLLRFSQPSVNRWIIGAVGVLFIAVWLFCAFRQFVKTPRAIVYLLLYACTLEVLPWALLYLFSNQTITMI